MSRSNTPPTSSVASSSPVSSLAGEPLSDQAASPASASERDPQTIALACECGPCVITPEMMEVGVRLLAEWERDDLPDMSTKTFLALLFQRVFERSHRPT